MNATAVERIKQPETEPSDDVHRILPPSTVFLVKWVSLRWLGLASSFRLFWPCPKVALDAATRLCWHILDDSLGQVGIFGVTLIISVLYLWLNLRFAAKNIDLVDGESFFNKAFKHPVDASRTINVVVSPQLLVFAIDFAIVVLSLIFAMSVSSQWDTYLRFRYGGSFGVADPLFGIDLGFYVFRLPFYELVQEALLC